MRYDLSAVPEPIAYKLLAATIIPRPIAWVVTQDAEGRLNAAPFSFFNVMGSAPPTVALGILADPARAHVDTDALDLVARSFGAGYIRSHDTFQLARPNWASRED